MADELEREVLWRASLVQSETAGQPATFASLVRGFFDKFGITSFGDQILVSGGVAAALASACFATFMITTDHSHPTFGGIEHLMLFAQPIHGKPPTQVAQAQKAPESNGVDYSATGTIRPSMRTETKAEEKIGPQPPTEPIIKSYVLQEAQFGRAVVQGHDIAYRVQAGSFLPGAGRVLSVEQRDDKWVVVTTRGIIVDHLDALP